MGGKKRVVSLLPSATDTVVHLKLEAQLVGRSHECDWQEVASAPVITSNKLGDMPAVETDIAMASCGSALMEAVVWGPDNAPALLRTGLSVYWVDIKRLKQLKPDVILTQCQDLHGALHLGAYELALERVLGYTPCLVHLAAQNLKEVWRDMQMIADALGVLQQGKKLVQSLQARMKAASDACRGRPRVRVACIQWPDPWYAAGSWVPELLHMAGATDVIGRVETAVEFTPQQLSGSRPGRILFAICGFDLQKSVAMAKEAVGKLKAQCQQLHALVQGQVGVLDGVRVFSRPGPWLVESLEVLVEILHAEAQQYGHEGKLWTILPITS